MLTTEFKGDGLTCSFTDTGEVVGVIKRVAQVGPIPSSRPWLVCPAECVGGDATRWGSMEAAEYYILALASSLKAMREAIHAAGEQQ